MRKISALIACLVVMSFGASAQDDPGKGWVLQDRMLSITTTSPTKFGFGAVAVVTAKGDVTINWSAVDDCLKVGDSTILAICRLMIAIRDKTYAEK